MCVCMLMCVLVDYGMFVVCLFVCKKVTSYSPICWYWFSLSHVSVCVPLSLSLCVCVCVWVGGCGDCLSLSMFQ